MPGVVEPVITIALTPGEVGVDDVVVVGAPGRDGWGRCPDGRLTPSLWNTRCSSELSERSRSIGACSFTAARASAIRLSARAFSCNGTWSPSSASRRSTW
jgi:hypothetical protein